MTAPAPAPASTASANVDASLAYTASDLSRTDTKAGLLLTLDGLLVAALSLAGTDLAGLALALALVGSAALIASVVLALLVIRPRLSKGHQDRGGYIYLATADPADVAEGLAADHRVTRLQALARIALRKMRLLRIAGDTALVAVVAIAAAILAR
ncbi:Pycsar system effector family protein [Streptomyces cinereoruber]|uniref:Pycsar system effector family protein n=1 Tax=Streptomyces cinereoruber TaxID=67260 RepID=UPI003C2BFF35